MKEFNITLSRLKYKYEDDNDKLIDSKNTQVAVNFGLESFINGYRINARINDIVYNESSSPRGIIGVEEEGNNCSITAAVSQNNYQKIREQVYDKLCDLFGFKSTPYLRSCHFIAQRQNIEGEEKIGGSFTDEWVKGKEIRVFSQEKVKSSEHKTVIKGLNKFMDENSLDFEIVDYGNDDSINEVLRYFKDGSYHFTNIAINLAYERYRINNPHADVIIFDKPFNTSEWGYGYYKYGAILIAPKFFNLNLLESITIHEVRHLLGLRLHCKDTSKLGRFGYKNLPYDPKCNFNWGVPSLKTCHKCQTIFDTIIYRVEKKHNINLRRGP
jgi:hypothetical protein